MILREQRERPRDWTQFKQNVPTWALPFFALEWVWEWLAYLLSNWRFVEVLEYLGSLSVLVAVFFYFHDADNRVKQRHYQAWQVINTAQGKGGSGGRLDALQELNNDGVDLVGVDVSGAFLQGVRLGKARLRRADFSSSDVRNGDLKYADLSDSNLRSSNFRQSALNRASLVGADLTDSDFSGADLTGADLSQAVLDKMDLRFANLQDVSWKDIASIKGANIYGAKGATAELKQWARTHGAVEMSADEDWHRSR